ncbi:MAG TPA: hypothetical protein VJT82_10000 [Pyrinomonadaceae bacterium]|nr:hypothetical protein [Pyrinomonadaceae bacterium]
MILMFVAATAASHREQSRVEGTWTGESICQVKSSPCHDEKAIYVVSKPDAAGKVTIDMGKIVEGKPETMGVLVFTYDRAAGTLVCDHRGVWKLKVMGDEMKGTLTLHDGTLYRRMRLKRAKS